MQITFHTITDSEGNTGTCTHAAVSTNPVDVAVTGLTFPCDIVSVKLENTSSAASMLTGGFAGLKIDGVKLLLDPGNTEYDLMQDGPAQNYATLNPLPPRSSGTIQNANLSADISSLNQYIWGTQAMTSKCYWETQFISGDPFEVGLVDIRATTRDSYLGGSGGNTYGYGTNGQITNNAASGVYTYATFGLGDVIGQAYDPESGKWWAYKNGVSITDGGNPALGVAPIVLPGGYIALPEDKREFMTPGFGPNGGTSRY